MDSRRSRGARSLIQLLLVGCFSSLYGQVTSEWGSNNPDPQIPLVRVRRDYMWGFADRSGQVVIPPNFAAASDFFDGRAAVAQGSKWGFIDETGAFVIPPAFDYALDFSEGLAPVKVNDAWGYISNTGHLVIPAVFQSAEPFSAGLARVVLDGRVTVIDSTGQEITRK